MITKEQFIEYMEKLEQQTNIDKEAGDLLSKYFSGFSGWYDNVRLFDIIFDFLHNEFDDKDDWISYYVYELDFGKDWTEECCKDSDGVIIDLSSSDKLYDFLIENKISPFIIEGDLVIANYEDNYVVIKLNDESNYKTGDKLNSIQLTYSILHNKKVVSEKLLLYECDLFRVGENEIKIKFKNYKKEIV